MMPVEALESSPPPAYLIPFLYPFQHPRSSTHPV
jgi:hypothetical protein